MPSSGITAWSLTALQVMTAAAQEIGVIGAGEELSADDASDCLLRLNMFLKALQIEGLSFGEATTTATITANVASVALAAGVRYVNGVRVVVSATNERPLGYWNRAQYYSIPNRTASGSPTVYYIEKGVSANTLYVWPVPTANTTVKLDYSRIIETVTATTETLDVPQEWQGMLIKGLAVEISNVFGAVRVDPITLQKVASEAQFLKTKLLDNDRPDAYVFEPYDGYC